MAAGSALAAFTAVRCSIAAEPVHRAARALRPTPADISIVGGTACSISSRGSSSCGLGCGACRGTDDGLTVTRTRILSCWRGGRHRCSSSCSCNSICTTTLAAIAGQAVICCGPTVSVLTTTPTVRPVRIAGGTVEVGSTAAIAAWCGVSGVVAVKQVSRNAGIVRKTELAAEATLVLRKRGVTGGLYLVEDDVRGPDGSDSQNDKG